MHTNAITHAARHPDDERAELLFADATRKAEEYVARHEFRPCDSTTIARLGYEVGVLHSQIRMLLGEVRAQKRLVFQRDCLIGELQGESDGAPVDLDDDTECEFREAA
jgi:hypothetical protein